LDVLEPLQDIFDIKEFVRSTRTLQNTACAFA